MADQEAVVPGRIARRQFGVMCSVDTDVPAVFFCSHCKKPFCEDCIGREEAGKTFCLQCASVEEILEEKAQRGSRFAFIKKKRFLFAFFSVLASIAIAVNGYILYNNRLESEPTEAIEPEMSPQLQGIVECRADLEVLVAEALIYRQVLGHFPASLAELSATLDPKIRTRDPVSHESYIVESDQAGNFSIHCPTPEAHGVGSITAVPGKPARITYLNVGRRP